MSDPTTTSGRRDWRGMVALILAFGATISVTALCVGAVLQDEQISPQGSALLTGALGTLLGAVSVYLGGAVPSALARRESGSDRRTRRATDADRATKPDEPADDDAENL